jgi:hypothetical protein
MTSSQNSLDATRKLKGFFLEEYGHFADKRIKNVDKGNTFIVDDRGPGDFGADRDLYSWFCMIFAEIVDQSTVLISLHRNVPQGDGVGEWCKKNNGRMVEPLPCNFSLTFEIKLGSQNELSRLADVFESIVSKRYAVPSYKYVCPRIAAALKRLQGVLERSWIVECGAR